MEHPLINNASQLTLEELSSKINELYKKLGIAQKSGNAHLCNQVRMALETYQNQYQQRLREDSNKKGPVDFNSIINIE